MGRRRRGSEWTRDCWESLAISQGCRTCGETGALCSKEYAGAAIPRLQNLMGSAAKATEPTPNATMREEDDRAASAQLYWMMLMICNGAALNIVFLAGDSEGLEAWRQLTEKFEPKMRTRFAGQLMSILSFFLQGDTTGRVTAWEREIATYERDSGKTLDDEIKIGTIMLRLSESQLKTHLLMRVDKLMEWTDFRDEVVAISRAIAVAQTQPTPMDIGAVGEGKSSNGGNRERKVLANVTIRLRCGNTDHTSANCPHSDIRFRKCGKVCVDLLELMDIGSVRAQLRKSAPWMLQMCVKANPLTSRSTQVLK